MTADSRRVPSSSGAGRTLPQITRRRHAPLTVQRHRAERPWGSLRARAAGTITALTRLLDEAEAPVSTLPVTTPRPGAGDHLSHTDPALAREALAERPVAAIDGWNGWAHPVRTSDRRESHGLNRGGLIARLGQLSDRWAVRLAQAWVTTVRRPSAALAGAGDDNAPLEAPATTGSAAADGEPEPRVVAPSVLPSRPPEEPSFPIDVVYTWVNDEDPAWRARYTEALRDFDPDELAGQSASPARFRNRDELRYSLRSLARNARFVRRVYVVTAGQVPAWLARDVPNLRVVPHEEILPPECLPTFNSHAIETALHRIEGLAEHYLYLNDDFFFGRGCQPSTFFTPDGLTKLFPDRRATVPTGPASPLDRPVDSASKNTRDLMDAEFDLCIAYKMQHTPYPQRRSVVAEMEERFPAVFKQTAHNTFRHYTDVNVASCFSHYYAYATGTAVPAQVPATYINIGNPWASLQMRRLLRRGDSDVFCLNDSPIRFKRDTIVDATVSAFLEEYFPRPSPFERAQ